MVVGRKVRLPTGHLRRWAVRRFREYDPLAVTIPHLKESVPVVEDHFAQYRPDVVLGLHVVRIAREQSVGPIISSKG